MSENSAAAGESIIDWSQEVNSIMTRTAIDLLRQVLKILEGLETNGVTVGECVLAVHLRGEDGAETPYLGVSGASPQVLDFLARRLESATQRMLEDADNWREPDFWFTDD